MITAVLHKKSLGCKTAAQDFKIEIQHLAGCELYPVYSPGT